MKLRLRDQKENLIYLALWLMLFAAPVFSSYIRSTSDAQMPFQWAEILHVWKVYAIFLVIFLLHNFVLAPLLIYKHKKGMYFATTGCLIAVFVLFNCMNGPRHLGSGPRELNQPPHAGAGFMPREPRKSMAEAHREELPGAPREEPPGAPRDEPPGLGPEKPEGPHDRPPMLLNEGNIVNSILLILLLGMNLGVKLYFKSDRDRDRLLQLERESVESQLEYLKYQINPHFFMNTLNNIHALVDIDAEQAKATIVDLSRLMRYVLYEGAGGTVPLQRDIEFIKNYIKLMRLRYTDRVSISVDLPDFTTQPSTLHTSHSTLHTSHSTLHPSHSTLHPSHSTLLTPQIPPMLLITFVENAFKHGVSYRQESFVAIEMRIIGNRLYFGCRNSKQPQDLRSQEVKESRRRGDEETRRQEGGVGLSNVRRRLDLLYGNRYSLDINDGDDIYSVSLDIPIDN